MDIEETKTVRVTFTVDELIKLLEDKLPGSPVLTEVDVYVNRDLVDDDDEILIKYSVDCSSEETEEGEEEEEKIQYRIWCPYVKNIHSSASLHDTNPHGAIRQWLLTSVHAKRQFIKGFSVCVCVWAEKEFNKNGAKRVREFAVRQDVTDGPYTIKEVEI